VDASVILVSASDKLHNARAILTDLHRVGPDVWSRFSGSRDDVLWYYRSLVDAYRAHPASRDRANVRELVDELARTVTRLGDPDEGGVASATPSLP
jgi:GTP pyrophosphokinase